MAELVQQEQDIVKNTAFGDVCGVVNLLVQRMRTPHPPSWASASESVTVGLSLSHIALPTARVLRQCLCIAYVVVISEQTSLL